MLYNSLFFFLTVPPHPRSTRPNTLFPFATLFRSALMAPRASMACTAAFETEIEPHYNEQLDAIGDHDPELTAHISDFRDEEVEHRRTAIAHRAEQAPAYPLLSAVVRLGCRTAIAISRRI